MRSRANGARHVRGERRQRRAGHDRRPATPIDDLKVEVEVEEAKPGSALDAQLRREQAKALLALLAAQDG